MRWKELERSCCKKKTGEIFLILRGGGKIMPNFEKKGKI